MGSRKLGKEAGKPLMIEFLNAVQLSKLDPNALAGYENSLKTYRDLKGVIDTAREEGREEGKLEGIIKVAAAMKQNGIPSSVISHTTGLTENEIKQL